MMAKDPAKRYQTGREILRDLARLRGGVAGSTMAISKAPLAADSAAVISGADSLPTPALSTRSRWIALYTLMAPA